MKRTEQGLRSGITLPLILLCASFGTAAAQTAAPSDCAFLVPPDAQKPRLPLLGFKVVPGEHPRVWPSWIAPGDYTLIRVTWQPAPPAVIRGRLHLEAAAIQLGDPLLIGSYVSDAMASGSTANVQPAKQDSLPVKFYRVGLGCGRRCGAALDVGREEFTITAESSAGFWGWWLIPLDSADVRDTVQRHVVPTPAGFFCALREKA